MAGLRGFIVARPNSQKCYVLILTQYTATELMQSTS